MSDERCRFFVPGPTWVRPEIRAEMGRPMIGHRSPEFREMFSGVLAKLRELFSTSQHAFVATSSGTGLLEGALLNCVPRSVLVTTCGAFSERWLAIAEHIGLEVDHFQHEWGEAVDPARLADFLASRHHRYDAVTFTHNETSTGVINDVEALARVVRDHDETTLVLVDAVSSLACAPIAFDEWGLDVALASVQKGLALPPGLTVFAVSDRAMERAATKHYRGTYFDFLGFRKQAESNGTLFTPAIPQVFALARQLDLVLREETVEARYGRHRTMRDLVHERTAAFADLAAPRDQASPSLTTLRPRGGNPREILARMEERGYTLGGGYGKWREETFRIGHMGDTPVADLGEMLDVLVDVASGTK